MSLQPQKTVGYRRLVVRFGAAAVGAAILAKWISADDADQKWFALAHDINQAELPVLRYITRAEIKVLTLFAAGLSARAVAERLGLSFETVKRQMQTAREHTDTDSITGAVAVGIRSGQVLPP